MRCLPIVTSVESFSDNSVSSNHGDSDNDIIVSFKRRSGRISSDSSTDNDSNFSAANDDESSLLSSQISSVDDVSSLITMTTDSDSCMPSPQSSSSSYYAAVTDSNHDSDTSPPHKETIGSRVRIVHSNQQTPCDGTLSDDCLVTGQLMLDQNYGNNIKRRLRSHRTGHQLHIGRSTTAGSLTRCILSISDSEQSDVEYLPSSGFSPYNNNSYTHIDGPCSSSSHAHIKNHQLKSCKGRDCNKTRADPRGIKRHHKQKNKRSKSKRRKLAKCPLHHFMTTPTSVTLVPRRARTVETSPRVTTVTDTPQSVIRQLVKARCQTDSLEEARRMSRLTQNDIIAHQVRSKQQQQALCWDHKVIDCYKSNTKIVCSPLKNAMKRHPMISSASLK